MIPRAIQIGVLLVVTVGCTRSDPGMIDIAASLVPEGSQITHVGENTGLSIEVGDYWGAIHIDDGDLGPALLEAIEEQAATREPVEAGIHIRRLGEGNPWPPEC